MVEDGGKSATTDRNGDFTLFDVPIEKDIAIKADAEGYLPTHCTIPATASPEITLIHTALLSGDITDDDQVDIADAVAIGIDFAATGQNLAADINRSGNVDVLDLILMGVNFGKGPQNWACLGQ